MSWVNLQDAIIDNFKTEPLPIEAGGTGITTTDVGNLLNQLGVENIGSDIIEIPKGSNLDDYMTVGTYFCRNAETSITYSNCPCAANAIAGGFVMLVRKAWPNQNDDSITQEILIYANGIRFHRSHDGLYEGFTQWTCSCGMDSVIAYGVSGVWTYAKWFSGKSECWCTVSKPITSAGYKAWGSIYENTTDYFPVMPYPISFIETPSLSISPSASGGYICGLECGGGDKGNTPAVFALRPNIPGSDMVLTIGYHAIGKWK